MRGLPAGVLLVFAIGCGRDAPRDRQTERRILEAPLGPLRTAVDVIRWHVHTPFGAGPGHGGFLAPAHDAYLLRCAIGVTRSDGTRIALPWERFVSDALLFEHTWDTEETEDARDRWITASDGTIAESCVVEEGRRLAIRARGPGVDSAGWRILVLDGETWGSTERSTATDCAGVVRESLP